MLPYTHKVTGAQVKACLWLGTTEDDAEQFLCIHSLWSWGWRVDDLGVFLVGPFGCRCYFGEVIVRKEDGRFEVVQELGFRSEYRRLKVEGRGLPKILKKFFGKLFSRP